MCTSTGVNLYSNSDVLVGTHKVLDRISTDYPLVMGRLDTRYSPVRRSSPIESKLSISLPLDLHVLSL